MPTYLSAQALEQLKEELEHRKKTERKLIAEKILHAKEMGDLSENFEYQTAKEEQALNETRILDIESKIHDAVIVEDARGGDSISIGATFDVESNGAQKTFSIVGSTEADPTQGKISNESPIGLAFLGKKSGEKVSLEVPSGTIEYTILKIH